MSRVQNSFESVIVSVPIAHINPQREINEGQRQGLFYKQIAASIAEIGLIEPLVVYRRGAADYLLLDGHMRLEVLKNTGSMNIMCLISTDDEAYTYNRRVSSIPPVAQHLMLLNALSNGLTEERIAKSLKVDVAVIRRKRDMLNGVCDEAVALLQTHPVGANAFTVLRKMKPVRQVEAAEHMIASAIFSFSFATAILCATKPEQLVDPPKARKTPARNECVRTMFDNESDALLKDLKGLEANLGREALTLTVFQGYIRQLLVNPMVKRYLKRKHVDLLGALQSAIEA